MPLDPEFVAILACPFCRAPVEQPDEEQLRCTGCDRRYPILNGVPAMRLEDASGGPDEATKPSG